MKNLFWLITSVLAFSACSTTNLKIVGGEADNTFIIRDKTLTSSDEEIHTLAQSYCEKTGKNAVFLSSQPVRANFASDRTMLNSIHSLDQVAEKSLRKLNAKQRKNLFQRKAKPVDAKMNTATSGNLKYPDSDIEKHFQCTKI